MVGAAGQEAGIFSRFPKGADIISLFSGGAASAVGLSIGSSSIKLVELKRVGRGWKLLHFGMVQLPDEVVLNREIVNPLAISESIRTLMASLRLKTKSVCTALSGPSVIIKRMSLDVPDRKELQDQVFWEAEQYIPFDIAEVVLDFQELTRAKDSKVEVVLVAAKRSIVESYISCVEEAGLKAKTVDTDYFALQTMFEENYPSQSGQAAALVDIGATSMKIVVVHAGVPVFTKDASIGGRSLTLEIQRHLGLSFADAEALKTGGQANGLPQEVSDLMHIASENFGTEIKRALDFYNASSSGAPVGVIYLCGGSAKIPGLSRTIEDMVQLPTQLANPFNSISYDPAVFTPDYVDSISLIAAVPIGLAIRAGSR